MAKARGRKAKRKLRYMGHFIVPATNCGRLPKVTTHLKILNLNTLAEIHRIEYPAFDDLKRLIAISEAKNYIDKLKENEC